MRETHEVSLPEKVKGRVFKIECVFSSSKYSDVTFILSPTVFRTGWSEAHVYKTLFDNILPQR